VDEHEKREQALLRPLALLAVTGSAMLLAACGLCDHKRPEGKGVARTTTVGFEDCGDGTVADHSTGLLWEKKTGELGTAVF